MADNELPQGDGAVATSATEKETAATAAVDYSEEATGDVTLPPGWMYRQRRIGKFVIPWYASPKVQLGMVAFVCFMCPGMFNALGGMGGAGKTDQTLADNMVSDAYSPQTSTPHALLTVDCRTLPCTRPSPCLVSSVGQLLTDLGLK
jgi:hypothetical protein